MTTPFDDAAALLEGKGDLLPEAARVRAGQLLADLGYAAGQAMERPDDKPEPTAHRSALLRAAGRMRHLFTLDVREAPGLRFVGGQADPAILGEHLENAAAGSIAGSGLSFREAFEACVGEGIEFLSQFEAPGDASETPPENLAKIEPFDGPSAPALAGRPGQRWVPARRLGSDETVLLPVERCLRRHPDPTAAAPPWALSTGCGAGLTVEAAALHGLLELIERDAAGLWWRGGRRGRPLPADGVAQARDLLTTLRDGEARRRSWLIDISTGFGIPCIVAVSCGSDGFDMACGIAARPTLRGAVYAALKEMCHIELAYEVIEQKVAARGLAALNAADLRHLLRARSINAAECLLLQPEGEALPFEPEPSASPLDALNSLVNRLERAGVRAYQIDLTRPLFGIPVVRIVAPGLQLEPCIHIGRRLAAAIAETGGGATYTGDVSLL